MKNYKIRCGIVSVTFRGYSVDQIIECAVRAKLDGIEWGGDIHVPHGDIQRAVYAAGACADAGLEIFSYGSYYRAGQGQDFIPVLDTAAALGAPNIRIWAGVKGSGSTQKQERTKIIEDIQNCAGLASEKHMTISFEYHGGTLTDNPESAVSLIRDAGCQNVMLYWQPNQFQTFDYNFAALKMVMPYLTNIHVFNWLGKEKLPLSDAFGQWREYIGIISEDVKPHGLLLEFSPDDTEETFLLDAGTLRSLAAV